MLKCKLLGHKLIQPKDIIFCERCGKDRELVIKPTYKEKTAIIIKKDPLSLEDILNDKTNK